MIKVIESGNKEFIAVCSKCGCKFSYKLEDVFGGGLNCPECGGYVVHPRQDTTPTIDDMIVNYCNSQTPRCYDCKYISYTYSNSTTVGPIPWCLIHGKQVSPEQPGCLSHKII